MRLVADERFAGDIGRHRLPTLEARLPPTPRRPGPGFRSACLSTRFNYFLLSVSVPVTLKSKRLREELAGIAGAREQVIEMQDKANALAQQVQGAREQVEAEVRSDQHEFCVFTSTLCWPKAFGWFPVSEHAEG